MNYLQRTVCEDIKLAGQALPVEFQKHLKKNFKFGKKIVIFENNNFDYFLPMLPPGYLRVPSKIFNQFG